MKESIIINSMKRYNFNLKEGKNLFLSVWSIITKRKELGPLLAVSNLI